MTDMMPRQSDDLASHGHLLVRRAILRDDWITDALLDLAAGSRTTWTTADWDALLAELASCNDTIEEWLVLHS